MLKFIRYFILVTATIFCNISFAQVDLSNLGGNTTSSVGTTPTASCSAVSGMVSSLDPAQSNVIGTVLDFFFGGGAATSNPMISAARGIATSRVKPLALQVGGVLAIISVLFAAITAAMEGRSIAGDVLDVLIKAAVVAGIIVQYDTIVGAGLDQLSSALTLLSGSNSAGTILGSFITAILKAIISPFIIIVNKIGCGSLFDDGLLGILLEAVVVSLITIVSVVLLLQALVEAIFGLLAGPIILAVAIAIGPLSIACANSSQTSGATDKWLSFALSGALMTGIGGIVLSLFQISLGSRVDASSISQFGLISGAFGMLVNVLIAGKIFSHIPDYAAALSPSGGSGAKGSASKQIKAAGSTVAGAPGGALKAGAGVAGAASAAAGATSVAAGVGGMRAAAAASSGSGRATQAAAAATGFAGAMASQAKDKIISSLKAASGKKK